MNLKIDTKEKFHEITPFAAHLSANMTEDFAVLLSEWVNTPPHSVILNLENVLAMDEDFGKALVIGQGQYYELSRSFVLCGLQQPVEQALDEAELLEMLNVTPTLSEAWDVVQMEEIERELLDGLE